MPLNAPIDIVSTPRNIVEQYNDSGANPQVINIYNYRTNAANYERGFFRWQFGIYEMGNEYSGSGQPHAVRITANGGGDIILSNNFADRWRVEWQTGNWLPWDDNSVDIGANGRRVRDLWLSRDISVGRNASFAGIVTLGSDPTAALQAATKQYVDNRAGAGLADAPSNGKYYGRLNAGWSDLSLAFLTQTQTDTLYLKLAGGTVTGPIVLPGNPTLPLQAATKQYVDLLQTQITSLTTRLTQAESDIATLQGIVAQLQSDITDLTARVGTNETNIAALFAHDNSQDIILSDLEHRVSALESGGIAPSGGPFIGDLVHVRDTKGHCQPSIVYEDWDGHNANGTVSVAVLSPVRLSESPWDSYIEVHQQGSISEAPFTTWHWPEMAFQYRRELLRKVATHAI